MIKTIFDISSGQYILVNLYKGEFDLIYTSKKEEKVRELHKRIENRIDQEDEKWIESILTGKSEYSVDETVICKEELKKFS